MIKPWKNYLKKIGLMENHAKFVHKPLVSLAELMSIIGKNDFLWMIKYYKVDFVERQFVGIVQQRKLIS